MGLKVTYNFDTGRWYENQVLLLGRRRDSGELDAEKYEAEVEALGRRLEEMEARLEGSFQIPWADRSGRG